MTVRFKVIALKSIRIKISKNCANGLFKAVFFLGVIDLAETGLHQQLVAASLDPGGKPTYIPSTEFHNSFPSNGRGLALAEPAAVINCLVGGTPFNTTTSMG